MSNEIRTSFSFQFWRSGTLYRQSSQKQTVTDTTSEIYGDSTQVVGTTHGAVDAGDVTDSAMMLIENLHATAVVEVGGDDSGSFVSWFKLPAGSPPAVVPIVSSLTDTYLKSSVASTPVRVTLIKVAA